MAKTASLAALFLVLYVSHDALGQEGVVVAAHVGDQSVSLPFIVNLNPNLDSLSSPSVLWKRGRSEFVHLREKQGDDFRTQSPVFKDRTRMNPDSFQTGNLTLVLSKPTINDTGIYICVVRDGPTEKGSTTVVLSVTDPPPPPAAAAVIIGYTGQIVLLTVFGVVVVVLLTVVTLAVCRQKKTKESFREACAGVIAGKPKTQPPSVL